MRPIRLTLVRHGEAAQAWGTDPDPGLSPRGRRQATEVAAVLAPTGPLAVVSSPLRRCRETARPLAERWATGAVVDPAVGEIPTPGAHPEADRPRWLTEALAGRWSDLSDELAAWRAGVVAALLALPTDSVVFTHFVAINVVLGWAAGDDRLTLARPDNCSCTVVEVADGRLTVVARGREAETEIR